MVLAINALTGLLAASNVDSYFPVIANASDALNGNALASAETSVYVDTVYSYIFINISANTSSNNGTVSFIKNAASGNQSFTVPALTTGYFEDTANTDSCVSGDKIAIFFDRGAGNTSTVVGVGCQSDTGSKVQQIVGLFGNSAIGNTANATNEVPQVSLIRTSNIGTNGRIPNLIDGMVASKLQFYVTVNARTSSTTIKSRKNAANGNQSVTVSAGATGFFEDTTNTDTYAVNDERYYQCVTGTGTGNFTCSYLASLQDNGSQQIQLYQMVVVGQGINSTSPVYISPTGNVTTTATIAQAQVKMRGSGTFKNFYSRTSANAATATVEFIININGVDTALKTSYATTVFGTASDTTNQVPFVDGDLVTIKYNKPTGSGTTTYRWFTLVAEYDDYVPQFLMV